MMHKLSDNPLPLFLATLMISLFSTTALALEPTALSVAAEKAKRSTVGILSPANQRGTISGPPPFSVRGSGTHIGNGYILTARHAIEQQKGGKTVVPDTINIITENLHELEAHFIGINAFLDIALYKIQELSELTFLDHAAFAPSESRSGEEVFTVGYPLGWGPALSFGWVGNPNTFLDTIQSRLIQIDLSACSGNSGGGLFNEQGLIVGVVHAIIQTKTTQGEKLCSRFAFAVPGLMVKTIVHSLIRGQQPKFSKLGITLSIIKTKRRWAITVGKVAEPARKAGFKKGDLFLAIDNHPIHTAAQLKNYLIEHTQPCQQVAITILRGEKTRTLKVILGSS